MLSLLKGKILLQLAVTLFAVLSVFWVYIFSQGLQEGLYNNIYTLSYPLLSLLGGIIGLIAAYKWGGMRSVFGRSILFFALGLFAQFFGQVMYSYYIYIQGIEVPYPSWGDLGYFGSVIFYILGIVALGRVLAIRVNTKTILSKLIAFVIPALVLVVSYFFFLKGYEFDWTQPLKVFLDFAYPLGQALYVSIALMVLLLSRKMLGGMMRGPLRFLIFALAIQYLCDFMFLYQVSKGTWYVGGINDFLYSLSYLVMTLALTYIGAMFSRIQES